MPLDLLQKIPRGIRNNNPGNIEYSPNTKWQGLATTPSDGRFCKFESAKYGIRALCIILRNYQKTYNLSTVRQIIDRWAPPVENNTDAYVMDVAKAVGVAPTTKINLGAADTLLALAKGIIKHENGYNPYSDDEILEAMRA
jgi:hypothetical protein